MRWAPLHWILKAPDVLFEHGGFDAIIGNPPFLGGKKLSAALGSNTRELMVHQIAGAALGHADLVAYFFLRGASLLNDQGQLGLIATSSVAEGDTREVGLGQLVARNWTIRRCIKSEKWPSRSANLKYAAIWMTRPSAAPCVLLDADGVPCKRIGSLLEPEGRSAGTPRRLSENTGLMFIGSYVNGPGFILDESTARALLESDARNAEVVKPFINADDLVNTHNHTFSRWTLDFGDMEESAARSYARPYEYARRHVRSYRERLANKPRQQELWWQFERRAKALYSSITDLDRVIAMPVVSKVVLPDLVATGPVFSHAVAVVASDDLGLFALLSSAAHQLWAITYSSTLGATVRYTPTDVFGTFTRCASTEDLRSAGESLHQERTAVMLRRKVGLTTLYNLVNDPDCQADSDVNRIRERHVAIDIGTMASYGWSDISLDHGFHTYRQAERFMVSPVARVEILDRLLERNHGGTAPASGTVPARVGLF
jgi:hypothetical protein